jgi:hypothetical protein
LNKAVEEKNKEEIKQQDADGENRKQEEQHHHLSLSTQAYKLFSDRKTPLQVAIILTNIIS